MSISVILLGHASFEIISNEKNIYLDPYEGDYKDKADLVLISHSHQDHCDPSKIDRIKKEGTQFVAPADCSLKIGQKVTSLRPGEKLSMGKIDIEAVEAYNYKRFRSPGNPYHPKGFGVGYLVTLEGKIIYHAGDTDLIPEMKSIENVHLALLPVGGMYTMDIPEAVEATFEIEPHYVIPMHRRGLGMDDFKRQVEAKLKTKVILLQPGEQFQLE